MNFLIPSLGQFLISMVCKFSEEMKQYAPQINEICIHLMSTQVRMETVALQIATAMFERMGVSDD